MKHILYIDESGDFEASGGVRIIGGVVLPADADFDDIRNRLITLQWQAGLPPDPLHAHSWHDEPRDRRDGFIHEVLSEVAAAGVAAPRADQEGRDLGLHTPLHAR